MNTERESRRLLLVGGAGDMSLSVDVAIAALHQARARGLRTHVTNDEATFAATPSVVAAADNASAVDHEVDGAVAGWVGDQDCGFDVVFGVREMAQVSVAETAEALGLPGNPPHAVRRVRTKDACRAALTEAGFLQPAVRVCAGVADAEEFLRGTDGPWVVKPRDGSGSEGVRKVSAVAELAAAVDALPNPAEFLVEEFVEGPEFSVEGVFLGGEPTVFAVTAKEKLPPPYFVEIGHVLPADIPAEDTELISESVRSALRALELTFGLFHVELWLTDRGVVIGEVHVRVGGGWIHRMLEHVIPGIDLYGLVYDDVLGAAERGPVAPVRAAASRYFAPPPGRVLSVTGWEEARSHPAVVYSELAAGEGDVIRPFRDGEDRVGVIVVGADTPGQARALAAELVDSVRFTVDPLVAVELGE